MNTRRLPNIGLVGLGALGSAIAEKLISEGTALSIWNRSSEKVDNPALKDATACSTIEELCQRSMWVLSCVSDDGAMLQVNRAIATSDNKPAVHLSFSSCSPTAVQQAATHASDNSISFINCPVLGRPDVVLAGKAGYLVAGETPSVKSIEPLFAKLGGTVSYLGENSEHAATIKLAMNYFIALTIGGLTEILAALGHDQTNADAFLDVIGKSPAGSPLISLFGGLISRQEFSPPLFDLQLAQKDLNYFADLTSGNPDYFLCSAIKKHISTAATSTDHALDWSGLASHLLK